MKPFKDMTTEQIIDAMNYPDLTDPLFMKMKDFIELVLTGKHFSINENILKQTEIQNEHLKIVQDAEKNVKYNNMYHRAVQIKELLDTTLYNDDKCMYWYYGLKKETLAKSPAEATKKLVEWFGEM